MGVFRASLRLPAAFAEVLPVRAVFDFDFVFVAFVVLFAVALAPLLPFADFLALFLERLFFFARFDTLFFAAFPALFDRAPRRLVTELVEVVMGS